MKKIATAHTFCDRKQFCGENLRPQMIFCAILQRKSFAQIWCKLTQNSAKNPRNASKFLRFCVAIAPQIFATGNPRRYASPASQTLRRDLSRQSPRRDRDRPGERVPPVSRAGGAVTSPATVRKSSEETKSSFLVK